MARLVSHLLIARFPPALTPDSLPKRIIIDDVTHYAYGQTEDRCVELWVAGKSGWYRISPAKGYLSTFNRMVQAVDMYYFLMDKHTQGKKQINPSFKILCEQVSLWPVSSSGPYPPLTSASTSTTHMATVRPENSQLQYSRNTLLSCFGA